MSDLVLASVRARRLPWPGPALVALLGGTALLYLVGLSASGWGNGFYAAAVEAGTKSWKAFFFGSFDSSNFITVDKPPASLWAMELSARIFGLGSWSILVPQALEGVAAVGLLYATVKRRFGPGAGLLAGAVLALTPVATLMFRFDNPDALLTLTLVAAAYALTRALETASGRRLALSGALVGLGFMTKMLQALLVVPGFAAVYLLAAPTGLGRRVRQLLVAGAALVVSGGWWVAIVELWPAGSRPYVGGSQDDSLLSLIFGYNGFGRLTGNESGSVVPGGNPGPGMWGSTGIGRLFGSEMGTQVSWLIPAALVLGALALWAARRAPRTDGRRAAVLLWGSWLVVTGLVFSFMQGIVHPYYNVVLAPAIGALVGIGAAWAWSRRESALARLALSAALVATVAWAYRLLERTPTWHPALRDVVLAVGLAAAIALALPPSRLAPLVASVALAAGLAAPAAYSLSTAATAHSGAIPSAGPAAGGRGLGPGPGGGGLGGLLDSATPDAALVRLLQANASRYDWVAAGVGANSVAGVQLATGEPVLAVGGFNGTDPSPTLAQFQAYVRSGRIHWFLASGRGGFGGPRPSVATSEIASWVERTFPARTVGGVTVYDLTAPASSSQT